MATYLILGTYSNKGAKGLVEKDSDRREAMKTLADSVGAKFLDYHITRGIYDFWILIEAESFDQIAAINLKAKSADTIDKADVLETVDINSIRKQAKQKNQIILKCFIKLFQILQTLDDLDKCHYVVQLLYVLL